jgi:hypothetical protein
VSRAGRQLWLAGLGAVASLPRLAERPRRRLRSLVDRLVEKGRPIAERHRARFDSLNGQAGRTVEGATTLLRDTAAYESRQLLTRFDMATTDDLRRLAASLDALDRKLDDYRRHGADTAAAANAANAGLAPDAAQETNGANPAAATDQRTAP